MARSLVKGAVEVGVSWAVGAAGFIAVNVLVTDACGIWRAVVGLVIGFPIGCVAGILLVRALMRRLDRRAWLAAPIAWTLATAVMYGSLYVADWTSVDSVKVFLAASIVAVGLAQLVVTMLTRSM